MSSYRQCSFTCIAAGSIHQANKHIFSWSTNAQCVANSACALAWKSAGGHFSTAAIDAILMSGDSIYKLLRNENCSGYERFLFAEELPSLIRVSEHTVSVLQLEHIYDALYPLTPDDWDVSVSALTGILQAVMAENENNVGFLFTGQTVTVAFWKHNGNLFVFDPHPVNENRRFDLSNDNNNLARLFQCEGYLSLASLLLSNAAMDGIARQFTITQMTFEQTAQQSHPMICDSPRTEFRRHNYKANRSTDSLCNRFSEDPKLNLIPIVILSPLQRNSSVDTLKKKKLAGRPKKLKQGRPKKLSSTIKEQIKNAKNRYSKRHPHVNRDAVRRYSGKNPEINRKGVRRYSEQHPEVHREAVRRYSEQHPEVNREAVRRYSEQHPEVNREAVRRYSEQHPEVNREAVRHYSERNPEVNREAVRRYSEQHPEVNREAVRRYSEQHPEASSERVVTFRLNNPTLSILRHVPSPLARMIVQQGPMGYWRGDILNVVQPFKLRKVSLWEDNIYRCPHCQARLFEEEKDRKKWCCGEGAYNVLNLLPLEAQFYTNRQFLERARAYNDLFAFCALEVSGGYRHPSGLSFFKIEGRMYHQVYSLDAAGQRFMTRGGDAQFVNRCRLYIDDGEERKNIAMGRSLKVDLINSINEYLTSTNPFINQFRRLSNEPSINAHLQFEVTSRSTHGPVLGDRQTGVEVHAVLSTEDTICDARKLTIWKKGTARPSSIDLFDPLMEPFQYPLLYPQGNLGWYINRVDNNGKKLSQYNYSRCLLLSEPRFSHFGRLSQAWQVEMFARYDEERLRYIRLCQLKATAQNSVRIGPLDEFLDVQKVRETGRQVLDDINRDETVQGEGGVQAGKIYLPSSFTGGPRYMKVHYENAMALVSRLGSPTFFLTFTYSATWEENKKACPSGTGRSDPSTACRIFHIKLLELLRDLRSGAMFGCPTYIVYVIEMQMRGLPHAHIVFKIDGGGPVQGSDIDSVIRADIPSEEEASGKLRELVLKHMVHGPCGTDYRTDFLCWDTAKGYCAKFYPKPACQSTHVDERGFVQYKRDYNNKGNIVSRRKTIPIHDGWIVPYNAALLLKYEAHINLELASTRRVIKYLFKYLMKGGSLQNVTVTPLGKQEDEVEYYVTKRMIGASDACWRLLDFPISKLEPSVDCLPVHLEGKQSIIFRPGQLADATAKSNSKLMLYLNRPTDFIFDNITYQSFFENFMVHTKKPTSGIVYNHPNGQHFITVRQRGHKVCRLLWVSPNRGELYYLRLLLMTVPCRGFADLLARGGPNCRTFQEVASKLGLVQDEDEYHHALREASEFMLGPRLRSFFVLLCNMGAPAALLWDSFQNPLCEDHLERNPTDPELAMKLALLDIDRSLRRQGSSLVDHGLPYVQDDTTELGRELLNYGTTIQKNIVEEWVPKLSEDQRRVFQYVKSLLSCTSDIRTPKTIFIDGPGGYGKTSLIRVILAYVRGCGQVALAVASSGIAAGNLAGGTTAHSMFRLPLDLGDGTSVWNITNGSQRAELIRAAQLIVFDEAPMAHRYLFEILDRSLRDLMNTSVPFGNKIFLCSGDFRQIAPVVEKARTACDVTCVSLRASSLWRLFKVFPLTTPHRTGSSNEYATFLLGVGNGTVLPKAYGEGRQNEALIPLFGIRCFTKLSDMISDVFPPNILRDPDHSARRSILSTLNVNVKEINNHILNVLDGQLHELRSADNVDKDDDDGLEVDIQLLQHATGKGVPDHILPLKIGSVCLIMRNLNIADGLVNGTKVIVTAISKRLVTVRLPGGTQSFGIPRITFRFSLVEGSPLRVCRLQFPLMLAYSMTGHKSQGQTIEYVGVDLRTDCFTHGQLYVLLSRVRSPNDIVVLVPSERVFEGVAYAKNIVYRELLL